VIDHVIIQGSDFSIFHLPRGERFHSNNYVLRLKKKPDVISLKYLKGVINIKMPWRKKNILFFTEGHKCVGVEFRSQHQDVLVMELTSTADGYWLILYGVDSAE